MISVDRIYQTLLFFANSDIRGNVKPLELRLALYNTVNEIIEEYFTDISRATNRENRGLINSGLENLPDRIREKLQYFLVEDASLTYASGVFALPANHRYSDLPLYLDAEIELCKNRRHFDLVKNDADAKPTVAVPIGLRVGNTLKVAPSTITSGVTLTYLRNPLIPNWTFTMVDGAEVFNPSINGFQDIDIHPGEENNIVIRTLQSFGINLKENDLVAYTQNKQGQDFNQDNAT